MNQHDHLIWAAFGLLILLVLVSFGSLFLAPGSDATVKEMIESKIIARSGCAFYDYPLHRLTV